MLQHVLPHRRHLHRRVMARSAATLAALVMLGGAASADGAFPDSMSLLLPADRPRSMVVGTNFGLIVSDDDGANWYFICEQAIGPAVSAYQMSAPPDDRLYAATPAGLGVSSDGGCSWSMAGGRLAGANVVDVFPDPADPAGVFAIARVASGDDGGADLEGVYQSSDGGRSFGAAALYAAPPMVALTGVEKARSSPQTLYLTMLSYPPLTPLVARSTAGAPFAISDESAFTQSEPYLAAVDPTDARVLYLRLRATGDALGISRDGGATVGTIVPVAGRMTALLRRADGTILVGSSTGPSLRSVDGGKTFAPWDAAPHVRALAERGGVLYVVASDVKDDFVVARAADDGDDGAHWAPLLHFRDIRGPRPCGDLPSVCAGPWAAIMGLFNTGDGGAAPPDAGTAPPSRRAGCGCAVGSAPGGVPALVILTCLLISLTNRKEVP
jgi:photosystem II stability/assembly factor-like uncharacterized protein